jgi:hypothetical protein
VTRERMNPAATEVWVRDHYAHGADALDVEGFMRGMADDVELSSGVGTVTGAGAVRESAVHLFSLLTSMSHDVHRVLMPEDDLAVVEASVNYRFVNGAQITLPCTTTFRFSDDLVRSVHLDIDSNAIAAAMRVSGST